MHVSLTKNYTKYNLIMILSYINKAKLRYKFLRP